MKLKSKKTLAMSGGAIFVVAAVVNCILARQKGSSTNPVLFAMAAHGLALVAYPFFVMPLFALGITFSVQGVRKVKPVEAIGGFALLAAMWIAFAAFWAFGDISWMD